jgi:hypothetical protein
MRDIAGAALALVLVLTFTYGLIVLTAGSFGTRGRRNHLPQRSDFVGRSCVIRSFRVDTTSGQAKLRGGAVIPVRSLDGGLTLGDPALIFDYDADGSFFWVMPYDASLMAEKRDH